MNILITGVGGMMGSHLVDFLIAKGHKVSGFDFVPTTEIRELPSELEYVECDIRNKDKLFHLLQRIRPQIIFHLAAQSFPTISWERPEYTIETNVLGTINLFEAVKELKLDVIVLNACTSGEYGFVEEKDVPIKESHELRPLHPYGVSKVAQELLAYQYFKNYGIKSISLRIFNTTGPKKVNDVCSDWTRQIVLMEKGLQEKKLKVGNLNSKRAITDVRDLIEAFWLVVEKGEPGVTYNLSGENVFLMRDLITILKKLTNVSFEVVQDPKLVRSTDELIIYGDSSKIKEKTGWKQKITIEQTLSDMLDYWRRKL
ncbi:MAG: GDP-mannose 4,6-dehydratase [Nanoarchaeota archaeon]